MGLFVKFLSMTQPSSNKSIAGISQHTELRDRGQREEKAAINENLSEKKMLLSSCQTLTAGSH